MDISQLRKRYHHQICSEIIRIHRNATKGNYPNFADGSSKPSVQFAWAIARQIGCKENFEKVTGQTAGKRFEDITRDFVKSAFSLLQHIRPGRWEYTVNTTISQFAQYEHLDYIAQKFKEDTVLGSAFGGDYIVKPDIVIGRWPVSDDEINKSGILSGY